MKALTTYLLRFAAAAGIFTIIFRYFLSYGIDNHLIAVIVISAVFYFISMFAAGWYFGRKDAEYLPILDVGFRFHATTYLIHNSITLLWIGFGLGSKYEDLTLYLVVAGAWGIFLLLHLTLYLWMRRKSIEDLDRDEIFE
jgi:hypothetical protein